MEQENATAVPIEAQDRGQNRRRFLAGLGGGLAALGFRGLAATPARAANGQALILGHVNSATLTTYLQVSDPIVGLEITNNDGGGLLGESTTAGKAGVAGYDPADLAFGVTGRGDVGVWGDALPNTSTRIGVQGTSGTGTGVHGENTGPTGLGVHGKTGGNGSAVYGEAAGPGTGVFGDTTDGTGVLAHSVNGTALWVNGTAHFSQSGIAVVPSGVNHVTVNLSGVTPTSMILATVQQGGGFYVKYAVPSTGSFTIYINKAPTSTKTANVAYLVLS